MVEPCPRSRAYHQGSPPAVMSAAVIRLVLPFHLLNVCALGLPQSGNNLPDLVPVKALWGIRTYRLLIQNVLLFDGIPRSFFEQPKAVQSIQSMDSFSVGYRPSSDRSSGL
ncbi:Ubiquitin-Like Domain-Containing Ctd Phosphatase 1 [Manis pentadactyla]|nr:Ubiquitin-Like Domain-Containing Ctd Phosphatase 1 [Manis pentadactyla]